VKNDPEKLVEQWTGRKSWLDRFSVVLLVVSCAGFAYVVWKIAQGMMP